MENCNCHNEIILKGSGQLERYLEALDPSYVSIDGRSFEDLLSFAAAYAEQIRFYDMPGDEVNDTTPPAKVSWIEFFKKDMAVIAASVASINLDKIKSDYENTSEQILLNPSVELYTDLLNQIVAIAAQIDQWYTAAIPENPLHADIDLAIKSSLSAQLKKLIAYEEGFIVVDSKTVLNIDFSKLTNKDEWGLNATVNPEFDIYLGTTPEARILNAVPYVDDIFQAFYSVISNIVNDAPGYLTFAITQYPSHQPYMALYIAFLQLFALAQEQMNGLTGRMLDFYYHDVLRLEHKPALPDKVFVIFQLAQNVAEYDLPQGTSLSAGKDASGVDQVYQTENDFVINQAVVKELKNIFIDKTPVTAAEANKSINAIYANPVANSLDGNGAKFPVPNSKWPTFNPGNLSAPALPKNICEFIDQKQAASGAKNNADIGFAIASPQLVLQGGNRLIRLQVPDLKAFFATADFIKNFKVLLTGEKGWLTIDNQINNISDPKTNVTWLDNVITNGIFDPSYKVTDTGFLFSDDSLYIYLPVPEQGIIAFNAKLHTGQTYNTPYPVMQVFIGPELGIRGELFNTLSIDLLSLSVKVGSSNVAPDNSGAGTFIPTPQVRYFDGLKKVVIQNDTGILPAGKPFDPFTTLPLPGSTFYIGSDEIFNKPLGSLAVNISKTQDIVNQSGQSGTPAQYHVNVLYNNSWVALADVNGANNYFNDDTLTFDILYHYFNFYNFYNSQGYIQESKAYPTKFPLDRVPIEYNANYNINADKGFLRFENVFGVGSYYNQGGISYGTIQDRLNNGPIFQIKEISVNYLSKLANLDPKIDQFFHIYPFGAIETFITNDSKNPEIVDKNAILARNPLMVDAGNLLFPQFTYLSPTSIYNNAGAAAGNKINIEFFHKSPQYSGDRTLDRLIYANSGLRNIRGGGNNQYSNTIQEEGLLFIGVDKLQPLQTLSLLFEFAPGSAIDEDDDPPAINWSYLIYNEWRPLNAENLLSDSTYGFQTTGIIKIDVPADANDSHTIVTDGLYWFCASVTSNSDRIPQLIGIIAQATEAIFNDQDNNQAHYDAPLPAGSISKLSVAVSQVKSVTQPYASFDGKHKEKGKEYYTRVSERLRHKKRAVTPWDYEHLVLEQFPEVFKVKCIPNVDPGCLCPTQPSIMVTEGTDQRFQAKCCGPVRSSANVLIVPVPNLKNDNSANPLQPKTSRLTLIEIVKYLTPLTSPFVTVHAKNPVYEQVIVFFRVKFLTGIDKGFYLQKLNEEIVEYLTPWAFSSEIEADFGQKIYASSIINFIQQRSYVDFITDFLMGVCRDECCVPDTPATTPVTAENFVTDLNQVSGCNDIEAFLKNQGYFIGDVIAEPSTPMSLLVSAPKHIILLYEEPKQLTVCEKRLINVPLPIHYPPPVVVETPTEQAPTPLTPAPAAAPEAAQAAGTNAEVKPMANAAPNMSNADEMKAAAPPEAAVTAEKHNVIEETVENLEKVIGTQTKNIAEKGMAAVKKAEDFIKNVVKGKSSAPAQIDPAPETKALPPAGDQSSNSNKS